MCGVEGCDKPVNKDGVCLLHKLKTLNYGVEGLKRERNGADVTGGRGTKEYVRDMYEQRRAAGMEDPVPKNKKAAAFAPRKGPMNGGYI